MGPPSGSPSLAPCFSGPPLTSFPGLQKKKKNGAGFWASRPKRGKLKEVGKKPPKLPGWPWALPAPPFQSWGGLGVEAEGWFLRPATQGPGLEDPQAQALVGRRETCCWRGEGPLTATASGEATPLLCLLLLPESGSAVCNFFAKGLCEKGGSAGGAGAGGGWQRGLSRPHGVQLGLE